MLVHQVIGLVEHLARGVDDLVLGRVARRDLVHVVLELGRHVRRRDPLRVLLEGLHHRDAGLGGLDRVVLHVAAVVELLDDVVARRLRAEALLLHHLDQLALPDPRWRLGFLRAEPGVARERQLLAFVELRDLLVLRAAVRIDRQEAGLDEYVAAHEIALRARLDVGARRLRHGRVGERREEPPDHQLVDLAVAVVGQDLRVERLGRVDRRVVGGLLLAPRRRELRARGDRLGLGERVDARDRLEQLAHGQRARIDRVVGAWVGDEAVHVEVFG